MKIKKFLPILVVLLVLFAAFTMMTVSASADEATPSEGLEYTFNRKGQYYTVTGIGTFTGTELVIPSTYNGCPVTAIGSKAFYEQKQLTKVVIPDTVVTIGRAVFMNCTSLKDVTFSKNITYIGTYMFYGCKALGDVVIPEGVVEIQSNAFRGATFTSLTLPTSSLTRIGRSAFRSSRGFKDLVLPDSITTVEPAAFYQCATLASITFGSGVTKIDQQMFFNCRSLKTVTFGKNIVSTGTSAFEECPILKTVNYSAVFETLGSRAFYANNRLENVVLPEGLKSIGGNAFNKCTALKTLVLPSTITNIGNNNGSGCTLLTNVYYCGTQADFAVVQTGSITAMKKVMRYYTEEQPMENEGNYWHYVDGVPTVWEAYVAPPVEEPSDYTLSEDGTYYTITSSTIELAGVTNLVLPATYKDLPVKAIAANAFAGNTTLKSIVIGASVVVENGAFDGSAVADIYFVGAAEAWNCVTTATVYFYSETQPTVEGNFWSYVDGEIVLWAPAGDDDGIELPSVGI